MSLTDWSLIVFGSTLALYMAIYFTMFTQPHVATFLFTFVIWAINMGVKLVYGLATDQIGFVLLFFLDLFMIFLVFVIAGRYVNDNSNN
jgi:hypothetical protein